MAKIILRQGGVTAKLSDVLYRPNEGFLEDNTWCVDEESICADADAPLKTGPATIQHGGMKYEVTIRVFVTEMESDEEADDDVEATWPIEIECEAGLQKLALALGLLDHLTPRQRREIEGS
jgi:hypothetical protein